MSPSQQSGPPDAESPSGVSCTHPSSIGVTAPPIALAALVGREHDVAAVSGLLEGANGRLLTLIGTGGVGKTRLAAKVAEESRHVFRDGARWVSLETLFDPALLSHFLTARLSIVVRGGTSAESALVNLLQRQQVLMVLDNCEHLLPAAARLVETLLSACPQLHILATSREPLALPGEVTWQVEPLSVPTHEAAESVQDVRMYDAAKLFVSRTESALPGFQLTLGNAATVVRICRKLEGLPLAIELAAAWLRVLSLEELASRLDSALPLLIRGSPIAPPRQQTLRATLDWSYRLLNDGERITFARLAVFPGSFSMAAVEHVCVDPDDSESSMLANVARLVDKSLVLVHDRGEETRYRMLEPIRQYARERLASMEGQERVYQRHQDWCVRFALLASAELSGPDQGRWLDRLESEHDNIRAALHWALAHSDAASAGQLAVGAWSFWLMRGQIPEGRRWLEAILAEMPDPMPLRAHLLWIAGILSRQHRLGAERYFLESIEAYRAMENREGEARSLGSLGFLSQALGEHARAIAYLEEGLSLLDVTADRVTRARVLTGLALSVLAEGDPDRAADLCQQARAICRELGDVRTDAAAVANLGLVSHVSRDFRQAAALWEESLAVRRNIGDLGGVAHVLALLGGLIVHTGGDTQVAATLLNESKDLRRRLGDEHGLALVYEGLSAVGAVQGRLVAAIRLAGAAASLRTAIAEPPLPWEREEHDRVLDDLRSRVGDDTFIQAWNHGQSLASSGASMNDLVGAVTVGIEDTVPRRESSPGEVGGLTPREKEVLRLLTFGLTYAHIGESLKISPRTVDAHVRAIFRKLDVHSRSAATRIAIQDQLI